MGYLHEGHISLVRLAKQHCDLVATSIYVNPKQFAPTEDFGSYPRNLERDLEMLQREQVDIVFTPHDQEMYPQGYKTYVSIEGIDQITREGGARPGFFRGVATVVTKLFNIVQPQKVFFGQKDGIQCIVIRKLVKDLNMPIEVVIGETLREQDGLAMSSRNSYLNPQQRAIAPVLYKALSVAKTAFAKQGERSSKILLQKATEVIASEPAVKLDYLTVSSLDTGEDVAIVPPEGAMISGAIW
eukprot:CAMPEP_0168562478 /NCGR_PEP_ID=MMETSP0413-20121227/12144_1 /TAXON_ID=136452 /ORGANISM="Filamoeba nolandi, Strain NC-AS-23-1" /LENGTH=241 /DNA_ID=CAMNT_0008593907 /DNA_START=132 /DNA_END=854 /DNA_ORIENTATION=+